MSITVTPERTLRRQQQRAAKAISRSQPKRESSTFKFGLGLLLVVVTLALYSPVRQHDFINYDDDVYVYKNPHVTAGLTWTTVRWAFTTNEQANWHPVTWLSHALDCDLFGLDPGWHHITNALIHALNALLLFILLQLATGSTGSSFLVAALFAWHPFNVGSVAWIAERKNLLSTFFFFLTLAGYGWYAKRPGAARLASVAGIFLLALASKPMAVTLPFVLLLLDYWPLQRIARLTKPCQRFLTPQLSIQKLLWEKWPLFVLSAASCVVTFWVQRSGGAVQSLKRFPLWARLGNAVDAYLTYIWKTFWPTRFALHYPHPGISLPLWKPILSMVILSAISVVIWKQRRVRPYLTVGWLWFVVTLVPVIGIVQVGDQAMADRYAYLPVIGLFLMTVWLFTDFSITSSRFPRAIAAAVVLAIVVILSAQQVSYWQDSVSVWSHTLEVTKDNLEAERGIATALSVAGDTDAALPHFLNVVRLDPADLASWVNIGAYYAAHGRLQGAIQDFNAAINANDSREAATNERQYRTSALVDLGFAYVLLRDYPNALLSFQRANRYNPDMVETTVESMERSVSASSSENDYLKLSLLLFAQGKSKEAQSTLEHVLNDGRSYGDGQALQSFLVSNLSQPDHRPR